MRRIGLRTKRKGSDPIGIVYRAEVRRQRKAGNYKAGEWDAHHLAGRGRTNLLFFVMIPRSLHNRIHQHPAWARAEGWLANVNGTFSRHRIEVTYARWRQEELVAELEK